MKNLGRIPEKDHMTAAANLGAQLAAQIEDRQAVEIMLDGAVLLGLEIGLDPSVILDRLSQGIEMAKAAREVADAGHTARPQ